MSPENKARSCREQVDLVWGPDQPVPEAGVPQNWSVTGSSKFPSCLSPFGLTLLSLPGESARHQSHCVHNPLQTPSSSWICANNSKSHFSRLLLPSMFTPCSMSQHPDFALRILSLDPGLSWPTPLPAGETWTPWEVIKSPTAWNLSRRSLHRASSSQR